MTTLTGQQVQTRLEILRTKTADTHKFAIPIYRPIEHAFALREMIADGWILCIDRCRLPHMAAEGRPDLADMLVDVFIVTAKGRTWLADQVPPP